MPDYVVVWNGAKDGPGGPYLFPQETLRPDVPSRDSRETKQCVRCSEKFRANPNQRYCSLACRRIRMLERQKSRPHWRKRYA